MGNIGHENEYHASIQTPSRSRQLKFSESANTRKGSGCDFASHFDAGQIFLLTKLLTGTDLRFYDFEAGAPVERWRSGPSGSS